MGLSRDMAQALGWTADELLDQMTHYGFMFVRRSSAATIAAQGKETPPMGIMSLVKRVEHSAPVQAMLDALTVPNVDHAAAVATRFETAAAHIAAVLPDGPALASVLSLVHLAQGAAVDAIKQAITDVRGPASSPVDTTTPAPSVDATVDTSALVAGADHPVTADPAAADVRPGATHPVTWTPEPAQTAQDAPAQADVPANPGTAASDQQGPADAYKQPAAFPIIPTTDEPTFVDQSDPEVDPAVLRDAVLAELVKLGIVPAATLTDPADTTVTTDSGAAGQDIPTDPAA